MSVKPKFSDLDWDISDPKIIVSYIVAMIILVVTAISACTIDTETYACTRTKMDDQTIIKYDDVMTRLYTVNANYIASQKLACKFMYNHYGYKEEKGEEE